MQLFCFSFLPQDGFKGFLNGLSGLFFPHNDMFPQSAPRNIKTYSVLLHIDLFLRTTLFSVFSALWVSVVYQFLKIVDTRKGLNSVDYFPNRYNFFTNQLMCFILLCSMQNRFCIKLSHNFFVANGLLLQLNCCKLEFLWVVQMIICELD